MGGNALKHLGVERVSTLELYRIYHHIAQLFQDRTHLVAPVEDKQDHGDIDIIVDLPADAVSSMFDGPRSPLDFTRSTRNHNVISVPYDGRVQVDLICLTDNYSFEGLCGFHRGGDAGMLIGRIFAHYGMIFSPEGIGVRKQSCPYSPENDVYFTDIPTGLRAIGLSIQPRFRTYTDVWDWVLSSPWATAEIFDPAETSHHNRSRDKKRPSMQKFLEYLETHPAKSRVTSARATKVVETLEYIRQIFNADMACHANILVDEARHREADLRDNYKSWPSVANLGSHRGLTEQQVGIVSRLVQPWLPLKYEREARRPSERERTLIVGLIERTIAYCAAAGWNIEFTNHG